MDLGVLLLLALVLMPLMSHSKHDRPAKGFVAKQASRVGTIRLNGPIEKVFPLFGPVREKDWAPGWDPVVMWPTDKEVAEGMVFVVRETPGDVYWVITKYDPSRHAIAYVNVLPGQNVNRIEIECDVAGLTTECTVRYTYVALSKDGNNFVERQTDEAYAEKMSHWTAAINHWLETGKQMGHY